VIVSEALYEKAAKASRSFVDDYEAGRVTPRPGKEELCWPGDVDYINRNLAKGFVQQGKVPNRDPYEVFKTLENTFWLVGEKLRLSVGAPAFSKATYRVYRDWDCFIRRAVRNLRDACE
jgi:hypothetical protein